MSTTTFKQLEQMASEFANGISAEIPTLVGAYVAKYGSRDCANFAPPVGSKREVGYLSMQSK